MGLGAGNGRARRASRGGLRPALLVLLAGICAALAWTASREICPVGEETCAAGPGGQEALRTLLPENGAVPGWARDGDPQEFAGEDLYTYIDGGAEIYQEYGFRRVVVQDYKDASGTSVSLEIFEMTTPAAAFGIYTFKRSGKGKSVPLGAGGDLEDYYLNFWKGCYLVTLTGFDEAPKTIEGIQKLAAGVDAKASGVREAPGLVGLLPKEGLRPESVRYLKGILGLNNTYDLHTARGLNFSEAVKADYGDGSTLIVLNYGPDGAFEPSRLELWSYLEKSERFNRAGADMVFQDGKGRFLSFAAQPLHIFVGIGADAQAARQRMMSAMPVFR